ncbi:MAG: hypothetical protein K2X57_00990 [Xanthobacteraceae bacterium]|nr:hypothetical protein [Xanthobacteraceae bacterium]
MSVKFDAPFRSNARRSIDAQHHVASVHAQTARYFQLFQSRWIGPIVGEVRVLRRRISPLRLLQCTSMDRTAVLSGRAQRSERCAGLNMPVSMLCRCCRIRCRRSAQWGATSLVIARTTKGQLCYRFDIRQAGFLGVPWVPL